ncbi:hypothetical protein STBA_71920 [Streptomyces sp. MP131-18]|nr:hypothetical protein STBA_71920 [Streptomyces sp. MP131-18]
MLPQPTRLTRKRRGTVPRHHPRRNTRRQHRDRSRNRLFLDHRRSLKRRLFNDHVRVRAADTERRHTSPPRPVTRRPLPRLLKQFHLPGRPLHVCGRCLRIQRLRQDALLHRQHHLDDTRHAGRLLGVADVGLHRTQPQRTVPLGTFLPVGGQQGTGLDRVTQCGARAVRLDHINIRCGDLRVRQRGTDHPTLRRTVRRRQTVRRTILIHRTATDHRKHLMTVTPRIRQTLQHDHARALAPANAVGLVRERLAPAAGGHTALLGKVHERTRQSHDRDTAGQRHRALTATQRRHRLVQRHQRRRTRRVHRHRRTRQTQRVGDPAGGHRGGSTGDAITVQALIVHRQAAVITRVAGADEDTSGRTVQRRRRQTRPLDRLPGSLQQQPLLRVHRHRLTRTDPEESRVEVSHVVDESALPGVSLPGRDRFAAELLLERVPATVRREAAHRIRARNQQVPELVRSVDVARVTAAHADDRDRLTAGRSHHLHRTLGPGLGRTHEFATQVLGERGGVRVVEDHRRGQPHPGRRRQPVPQLNGT